MQVVEAILNGVSGIDLVSSSNDISPELLQGGSRPAQFPPLRRFSVWRVCH